MALRLIPSVPEVSDALIFDDSERMPDETLRMRFEAIRQFDEERRRIVEGVLDSLINNHQAKRLSVEPSR